MPTGAAPFLAVAVDPLVAGFQAGQGGQGFAGVAALVLCEVAVFVGDDADVFASVADVGGVGVDADDGFAAKAAGVGGLRVGGVAVVDERGDITVAGLVGERLGDVLDAFDAFVGKVVGAVDELAVLAQELVEVDTVSNRFKTLTDGGDVADAAACTVFLDVLIEACGGGFDAGFDDVAEGLGVAGVDQAFAVAFVVSSPCICSLALIQTYIF